MRDYMYEIEKLKMEIGEIKMLIEDHVVKRDKLIYEKGYLMFDPEYALQQVIIPEIREQKLIESMELKDIYNMHIKRIEELNNKLHIKQVKLNRLRGAFKRTHSQDFYRFIDEIDIHNIISKDGFILGIKF